MRKKLLTTKEAAQVLQMDPMTVRRLCKEKKLPGFKVGGRWRFLSSLGTSAEEFPQPTREPRDKKSVSVPK